MNKQLVVSSIIAPNSLTSLLRKKYNLSSLVTCKVMRIGINHSYLVTDGNAQFVFRIYSHGWRSETEIGEELQFIRRAKENNITVSYPLPDNSGNYIQSIDAPEGTRFAVLFSFASGHKVRNLSEGHCYQIGVLMEKLHSVSINYSMKRTDYSLEILISDPYQYATEHFSESLSEMQFIRKASAHIINVFGQADLSQLRYGAIHLDIWYDNFNIDENSIITLFDFDFCG